MAAKGMPFPWQRNGGTVITNLDVIWEMMVELAVRLHREFRRFEDGFRMLPTPKVPVSILLAAVIAGTLLLSGIANGARCESAENKVSGEEVAPEPAQVARISSLAELTLEERLDILARLSDTEIRALFLAQLDRMGRSNEREGDQADFLRHVDATMTTVQGRFAEMWSVADRVYTIPGFVIDRLTEVKGADHLLVIVALFAAMILGGLAAEWILRRATSGFRSQITSAMPEGLGAKFGYLTLRIVMDLFSIGVFCAAALGVFFLLYQGIEPVRLFAMTYLWAIVLVRIVTVTSRFILAPSASALRMLALNDTTASYLHQCVLVLAIFGVFMLLTGQMIRQMGIDIRLFLFFMTICYTLIVGVSIIGIWRSRKPIARMISPTIPAAEEGTFTQKTGLLVAGVWHVIAIALVLFIWVRALIYTLVMQETPGGTGFGIVLLVIAVPLVDMAIRNASREYFANRRSDAVSEDEADVSAEARNQAIVVRIGRILLGIVAVAILAGLLGVDILGLSESGPGAEVTQAIIEMGVVVFLSYVLWELAKAAIDRRLSQSEGDGTGATGGEPGGTGASRLKTLLPLFRKFLMVTIVTIAVMVILSAIGVNIGPLLAGAGVIGIAIGFGAQTLVRDIVSGVFFLADDAFRVGEYVNVGAAKGTVERITVRSLILRHHMGPLNIVPMGEISNLTNFSRDFNVVKLQFRVSYDTDMNKVKKIVQNIGEQLMADEEVGPSFIEPLKSQGVYAMEDSAMIIRVKFTTKPGQQFTIRKMVYQRIQKAFRENGIQFAHRQVTVNVPGVSDLESTDEESDVPETSTGLAATEAKAIEEAAGAAALAILAQEEEEQKAKR